MPEGAPQVLVEERLTSTGVSGHPDLVFRVPEIDILIDYKFGFKGLDYEWNMRGYAGLLMRNPLGGRNPVPVRAIILWIQDGSVQSWEWAVKDIWRWEKDELFPRIERRFDPLMLQPRVFTVGEHCPYCPIYHSCPGRIQIGRASTEIVSMGQSDLDMLNPQSIIKVWDAACIVEKAASDLKDYIQGHYAAGGEVEYQDERLEFRLLGGTPHVDTPRAVKVLTEDYGIEGREIVEIAKLPLSGMVSLITGRSAPGKKKADEERLRADLLAAKAITPTTKLMPYRKTAKPMKEIC